MIKKIYNLLIFLTGFSLLWQTKFIIRPAEINYWEISLFLPMIFLFIFIIVFYKELFLNFKNRNFLTGTLISLLFLELFIIISIFFAHDYVLSLYRYLIFILAVLLYLIVKKFNRKQKEIIIFGVFLAAFFQAIIAFFQFIWQKSIASKYLGMGLHDSSVLGTSVVETSSGRWLRAYGAFDHPNILGGVMALICLWSAWFLIKNKKESINIKLFLWLVYLSSLTALFFSFSRSAWLAFILVKVILIIGFIIKKNHLRRLLLIIFSSILLLLPFIITYQDLVSARIFASGRIEQISVEQRQKELNEFNFKDPKIFLFGKGFGNYTLWQYKQDEEKKPAWSYQPIHNTWLLVFSEIGIFGFLAFISFFFFLIKKIIIKKGNYYFIGLLTIVLFSTIFFFDHFILSIPFGLWLLFLFLAIIE